MCIPNGLVLKNTLKCIINDYLEHFITLSTVWVHPTGTTARFKMMGHPGIQTFPKGYHLQLYICDIHKCILNPLVLKKH